MSDIERIANARRLTILLTTHNPALMDALPIPSLPDAVFSYRNPHTGKSQLTTLADLPDYPALIAQGALGSLIESGTVDRFVKRHFRKVASADAQLDWLRALSEE